MPTCLLSLFDKLPIGKIASGEGPPMRLYAPHLEWGGMILKIQGSNRAFLVLVGHAQVTLQGGVPFAFIPKTGFQISISLKRGYSRSQRLFLGFS